MSDEPRVIAAFEQALAFLGRLDVLVTSAGIAETTPFMDISVASFRSVYEVNVIGTFLCIREAARRMQAGGRMPGGRGENQLDSGAYYYEVYECADGQYISIAPIEAKFHAELLRRLEIDPTTMQAQRDTAGWPRWKELLTQRFLTRSRDEWCRSSSRIQSR